MSFGKLALWSYPKGCSQFVDVAVDYYVTIKYTLTNKQLDMILNFRVNLENDFLPKLLGIL